MSNLSREHYNQSQTT